MRGIQQVVDGIESLRNLRVAMLGVNPTSFATTFVNQVKLFELGISLEPFELLDMWGAVVLARVAEGDGKAYEGDFGKVRIAHPVRKDDPRVEDVKAKFAELIPNLTQNPRNLDVAARCFLWVQDTFEREGIDAGAVHCWGEFSQYFGIAPCGFAMLANAVLQKPVVCEVDVPHAIMAKLAWAVTGEAGVILDVNNNGWDPRVFNVFHCSQTPPNWIAGDAGMGDYGAIEGNIAPVPFTGIAASTSGDAASAVIFQGQFLREDPGKRG